jgi:hypothetical protein
VNKLTTSDAASKSTLTRVAPFAGVLSASAGCGSSLWMTSPFSSNSTLIGL